MVFYNYNITDYICIWYIYRKKRHILTYCVEYGILISGVVKMIPRFNEIEDSIEAAENIFRSAPLHWHTDYEIELTITGSVRHIVNGQVYMTSPGFVSIMTPCDFHQYVDSGCESLLKKTYFTDGYISPEIKHLILTMRTARCIKLDKTNFERVSSLFDELIAVQHEGSEIGRLTKKNLAERTCLLIVENCLSAAERLNEDKSSTGSAEYDGTSLLNTVLTYISEHFTEKISLDQVAQVVHLSPNYLSHLFSRSLGTTFSQYVKLKRVGYASVLLLTTDDPIDEVAYMAGFSSTSFFNSSFKAQYKLSPFAYRARYRV